MKAGVLPRARTDRGLGGWDDERRARRGGGGGGGGVVEVEADVEGDLSDGVGVESVCGAG